MTQGTGSPSPVLVECDMEIDYAGRRGTVTLVRGHSCDILWHEHVDAETGEVRPSIADSLAHEDIHRGDDAGAFRVVKRPGADVGPGGRDVLQRKRAEIARKDWRLAYVRAARDLIRAGEMGATRSAFRLHKDALLGRGQQLYTELCKERSGKGTARGGKRLKHPPELAPPGGTDAIHKWYLKFERGGEEALYDAYANSGRRGMRYCPDEEGLARSVVSSRLDEERPTTASILDSVHAAFEVENRRRMNASPPEPVLRAPGYDYVHNMIDRLAPVEHAVRTRGFKSAYADTHSIGYGVDVTRPLQRVEIDEYTVDLMTLLRDQMGILSLLPEGLLPELPRDREAGRLRMSAAIDVHTRCLLALQITPVNQGAMLAQTLQMILMDKHYISDGIGAMAPWSMHGRPEMICLDRDPVYRSDETAHLLSSLHITQFGPPVEKPWLRPVIERFFRTCHESFLQRFSGRTFGDVVKRGDNDAEKRASVTFDEFLLWVARWIVDVYHATPHSGLNGNTPIQKWNASIATAVNSRVSKTEMRLVFGTRSKRKLRRSGIRVMHIDYQSDELARVFHGMRLHDELEVAWWPHDLSAIEVRLRDDSWTTVPATDPFWHGKCLGDLVELRRSATTTDLSLQEIRMKGTAALDAFAREAKARRGLLAENFMSEADLRRVEQDHSKFMQTSERDARAPDQRDLFADPVTPDTDASPAAGPAEHTARQMPPPDDDGDIDDNDIME